ncbi:MAG: sigma-70 family RNA polymerase sigma factor [Chloroflexi bacterium]|nr:sigma-70 family RNA polymerase sigma factor [Chloroflexota bacterium]
MTEEESVLLESARRGDQTAFAALVEPYRGVLHVHCYQMLGSLHDADDAVQDSLLGAWRGLSGFQGRSSLRTWLFQIATNASLKLIQKRPRRLLPIDYVSADTAPRGSVPPVEATWLEPYPDEIVRVEDGFAAPEAQYEKRESIELAFVAAVQHLSPRQRAVLILRDVLGFSAQEVADSLETTLGSVNSALHRARRTTTERVHGESQQLTLRALGDDRQRQIVGRYMSAWERGDMRALIDMLTKDARWSMPPETRWYRNLDEIVVFLNEVLREDWRHVATRANGQLAVGCYIRHESNGMYVATVLDVLTLRGDRVREVTSFITPEVFARFSLPAALPA